MLARTWGTRALHRTGLKIQAARQLTHIVNALAIRYIPPSRQFVIGDVQTTELQIHMNGANLRDGKVEFRLWAPKPSSVTLRLMPRNGEQRDIVMHRGDAAGDADQGTWIATAEAEPGDRYQYLVGDLAVPDPISRLLPEGVHGPTEIVSPDAFQWTDHDWRGLPLEEYVIYELHVGTFTREGTLDAAIGKLDYLRDLGITVIELMPMNATPGKHNWGYDGVGLYAVQANYGGPDALRRFVDAAHQRGLAVIQDVIYNHLGNEGNYLSQFGPYFTAKHKTPWGDAINYDDTGCRAVRRFVVENALYWLREYHMDGLRLDAVQTIKDDSRQHIVAEIAQRCHEFGREQQRTICVTCETDENDTKYVKPVIDGGFGVDAVWSDDFHHAVHVALTKEDKGYYQDFADPALLTRALSDGFAFQGEPFAFWKGKGRGTAAKNVPLPSQIICTQNHDQVGNRALGERINPLIPRGARKLSAALLLLAPHTPLLFMGQEYDEPAPFQFFTDYGDPVLQKAVSEGRRNEFADFDWSEVPDPQDPNTFEHSRLTWPSDEKSLDMIEWYRSLLQLRKRYILPGPRTCRAEWIEEKVLKMQVPAEAPRLLLSVGMHCDLRWLPGSGWKQVLSSSEDNYCVHVYVKHNNPY